MPKLLFFVPCERVIVDDIGKQVSMISVVESLTVSPVENFPEDAAIPLQWMTLAFWRREAGEENRDFEERVQIVSPSGEAYAEDAVTFKMHMLNHRVRHSFFGIRVGRDGDTLIKLSVRSVGSEEWQEVAAFPIHVIHSKPEVSTSEASNEEGRIENAEVG